MSDQILTQLAQTIASKRAATSDTSYTKSLLDKGIAVCAKKLGEEAVETVIAAVSEADDKLCSESADLLYHLLVVLEARNLPLARVLTELERRMGQSGLEEKASRSTR